MLARYDGINHLLIKRCLLEWLQALFCFCSLCTAVIARRADDGRGRLVISQCNGGMYPWGNQGQPPLLVQSDTAHRNADNHANDGSQSGVERGAVANHKSQFNTCVCLSCCTRKAFISYIGF